ncbi:hypothetical protein Ancab_017555 [Ancistrocladus abbreviatus]
MEMCDWFERPFEEEEVFKALGEICGDKALDSLDVPCIEAVTGIRINLMKSSIFVVEEVINIEELVANFWCKEQPPIWVSHWVLNSGLRRYGIWWWNALRGALASLCSKASPFTKLFTPGSLTGLVMCAVYSTLVALIG